MTTMLNDDEIRSGPSADPARIVACVVGLKGLVFISKLLECGVQVGRICSYDQDDDRSGAFGSLKLLAAAHSVAFDVGKRPERKPGDLILLVGWQYLIDFDVSETAIVFHDSLLPQLRGFAPTATALIRGEARIGVTALKPVSGIDAGPIFAQAAFNVTYPMTIAAALDRQSLLMAELAIDIVAQWREGRLHAVAQDDGLATYSVWRDMQDYLIDWSLPASEIIRLIDASGYPYAGARSDADGDVFIVDEATALPDLAFAIRTPGKLWSLADGVPVVICGAGLLRLDRCRRLDGQPMLFKRLRMRLGNQPGP